MYPLVIQCNQREWQCLRAVNHLPWVVFHDGKNCQGCFFLLWTAQTVILHKTPRVPTATVIISLFLSAGGRLGRPGGCHHQLRNICLIHENGGVIAAAHPKEAQSQSRLSCLGCLFKKISVVMVCFLRNIPLLPSFNRDSIIYACLTTKITRGATKFCSGHTVSASFCTMHQYAYLAKW